MGSTLLGWDTVCAVEIDAHCQRVLAQRQRDGHLKPFPIWDDIRTFDGKPWNGCIDVVSGGFPCQDISSAGRGAGLAGDRSGLWFEMLRVIGEVRPAYVFAENSPMLRTRGLDVVLQGLADLGFDVAWGVLGAWHVGAPINRERLWISAVAQPHSFDGQTKALGDQPSAEPEGSEVWCGDHRDVQQGADQVWALSEDVESGVVDGMANRLERLRAVGNGQVPAVAALAWRVLSGVLG